MRSEPKPTADAFYPETGKVCRCEGHKIQGTGAVFFQSLGYLYCIHCGGWQKIRHVMK